ncbi:pyridoxamine 5'-phosphate oxidase family protein [Nocardia sp. NBC_00511]|uniref:pyridoxamine 5'-phosphate oxidase family protein n=1 Tax=Nocardia sp. NBC_00511 TaxID=2903591 RepID=UPI0030E0F521
MDSDVEWARIRQLLDRGRSSTGHFAIGSLDPVGGPSITPVGTVFFRDDRSGFYFDQYATGLRRNLDADPRVCLMSVDSGSLYWFRSLLTGRFATPPGVRLYGTAGPRRPATDAELEKVRRRVRPMRALRGGRLLWSDFTHVRDLTFTSARLVRYPVMMSGLPQEDSITLAEEIGGV